MSCLHGIWTSDLPQPRESRKDQEKHASSTVNRQVAVVVARGIIDLEIDLLAQLQKLIFDTRGPGKKNMLPIWICLWLLLLTYRATNHFWRQIGTRDDLSHLSQHMYDMLVSIYSGLFKPSSPLWLNWLKDDVLENFGRDPSIIERMGNLKTEMKFCCSFAPHSTHVGIGY